MSVSLSSQYRGSEIFYKMMQDQEITVINIDINCINLMQFCIVITTPEFILNQCLASRDATLCSSLAIIISHQHLCVPIPFHPHHYALQSWSHERAVLLEPQE